MTTIGRSGEDARRLDKAEDTVSAMEAGALVINRAVLRNPNSRTYGIADLLVRSDEPRRLFPDALTKEEAEEAATGLPGAHWHYRVVDIKFTTLNLLAGGDLGNDGSKRAYKGQLHIYNEAVGRIQGCLPPASYLLGRSWAQNIKNKTIRGNGCLERLGRVLHSGTKKTLANDVQDAVRWVQRLRHEGATWTVLPEPSVPELRPNMGADGGHWTTAVRQIAGALEELTSVWYVGVEKRRQANALGIYRWSDPRCTAEVLGITGAKTRPILQAILDINRSDGPPVAPKQIAAAASDWCNHDELEFYVDFETVSDLDDDFTLMPNRGGQPMIFMIGCGHLEQGAWHFHCFTAKALTPQCESTILNDWLAHMRAVRARLCTGDDVQPRVMHWSQAETSNLRDAYNAAIQRHPASAAEWSEPHWFDFLKEVVRAEPVVVRGAWGFGLKKIAQSLHQHGFIATSWDDGPTDGLGAMVGAWSCAKEALERRIPLIAIDLMQRIQRYNEVDCKTMMEIVRYLRTHHLPAYTVSMGGRDDVATSPLRIPAPTERFIPLVLPECIAVLSRDEARIFVDPADARAIDAWNEVPLGGEWVLEWLKQPGELVAAREAVITLRNDCFEPLHVLSPVDGRLAQVLARDGEVAVDAVLGLIEPAHLGAPLVLNGHTAEPHAPVAAVRAGGSLQLEEGYRLQWDESGLFIEVTDYHATPLKLSWRQLRDYARNVGLPLDLGGGTNR